MLLTDTFCCGKCGGRSEGQSGDSPSTFKLVLPSRNLALVLSGFRTVAVMPVPA